MKIKVFLHFPDEDTTLQALVENPGLCESLAKELNAIKVQLKKGDFELYYDDGNLQCFFRAAKTLLEPSYLNPLQKIRTLIGLRSTDVNLPHFRDNISVYAIWKIDVVVTCAPIIVSEAFEASLNEEGNQYEKTCCVCLADSLEVTREELHVIKDSPQKNKPPKLSAIDAVGDYVGFMRWYSTLTPGSFALKLNPDFEPINKQWNKQMIYKKTASNQYWYFDFFHKENKIHYEVFDQHGNHIGEANSAGIIQQGTRDVDKKIGRII